MGSVTRGRVEKAVSQEADYAAAQVLGQINQAIEMSRNISRYTDLYTLMTRETGSIYLMNSIQKLLYLMYGYQDNIMFAGIFLWKDPDFPVYIENVLGAGTQYTRRAHAGIMAEAYKLNSRIGFYIDGDEIYLIRNILDRYDYQPIGTLALRLNPSVTLGSLIHMEWEPDVLFCLSDKWGGIRTEAEPEAFFEELPYGYTAQTDNGAVYYGKWKKSDYSFSMRLEIPMASAFPELRMLMVIEAALVFLIVPMLGIVLFFFARNVNRPIHDLLYIARRLEAGELGVLIDVADSSAEFNFLTRSFNNMSTRLKELFDEVYREELAVRDAKILALRSQINPHFLNNTLELMNWQARMSGAEPICDMIAALSTLMDTALNRSGNRVVPLREELSYADAYIYIISQRFGSRLSFERKIDETLMDVMTPPLVIQPLMENAVVHGLEKLPKGEMKLSVFAEDGEMILEVFNSGSLSASDERKIQKLLAEGNLPDRLGSAHLGIRNVQERLTLLYGGNSRLSIQNDCGGTVARIRIPIRRDEGNISQQITGTDMGTG